MHTLISPLMYNRMTTYCVQQLPNEGCGVLLGIQDAASSTITMKQFIPLPNISLHPETAFEFDQQIWTRLLFDSLASNQPIMGLVHSHPTSLAIPSSSDLQSLWHTIPTQWIISCIDSNNPILKVYHFHADGTYEQLQWLIQD